MWLTVGLSVRPMLGLLDEELSICLCLSPVLLLITNNNSRALFFHEKPILARFPGPTVCALCCHVCPCKCPTPPSLSLSLNLSLSHARRLHAHLMWAIFPSTQHGQGKAAAAAAADRRCAFQSSVSVRQWRADKLQCCCRYVICGAPDIAWPESVCRCVHTGRPTVPRFAIARCM